MGQRTANGAEIDPRSTQKSPKMLLSENSNANGRVNDSCADLSYRFVMLNIRNIEQHVSVCAEYVLRPPAGAEANYGQQLFLGLK
jgi:hypothetical protein